MHHFCCKGLHLIYSTLSAWTRDKYNVYPSRISSSLSCAIKAGQRAQTAVSTDTLIYNQQYKLLSAKT